MTFYFIQQVKKNIHNNPGGNYSASGCNSKYHTTPYLCDFQHDQSESSNQQGSGILLNEVYVKKLTSNSHCAIFFLKKMY